MQVVQAPGQLIAGYLMGKVEGKEKNWHGHVTAVTVAPQFRRLGIASKLMKYLEDVSENTYVIITDSFMIPFVPAFHGSFSFPRQSLTPLSFITSLFYFPPLFLNLVTMDISLICMCGHRICWQ